MWWNETFPKRERSAKIKWKARGGDGGGVGKAEEATMDGEDLSLAKKKEIKKELNTMKNRIRWRWRLLKNEKKNKKNIRKLCNACCGNFED